MIDSEQLKQHMVKAVEEIRATNPMAGSITNTVTIDFVANAQLAVGGSAAMVYLPDEGEALVAGGGAIYLNMGTLFPIYEQTIPRAAKAAHDAGKPWVLDPVGLGIGSLRTQLVNELKQYKPAIVRGNASEIIALAGLWGLEGEAADLSRVRGVDTTDTVDAARDAAVALARYTGGAVVVSGEVDLITDGTTVAKSHGGSPLMSKITGCGCSQGGVLAADGLCVSAAMVKTLRGAFEEKGICLRDEDFLTPLWTEDRPPVPALRIVFDGGRENQPIIAELVRKCDVDVNILSANIRRINDKPYGQMLIEMPADAAAREKIIRFLNGEGLTVKEVWPQ